MTIYEFAEVATPTIAPADDTSQVQCRSCDLITDATTIAKNGYCCPDCDLPICVMCGCTEESACVPDIDNDLDGAAAACHWINPGICSSHKDELKEMANRVFGGLVK
jgi:hypothetical protein